MIPRLVLVLALLPVFGCGAAATTTGYKRCSVADAAFAMQIEEGGSAKVGADYSIDVQGPATFCAGKEWAGLAQMGPLLPMLLKGAAASQGIPLP